MPKHRPELLVDPPELAKYADRGDPPMSRWPGRPVTRIDVMKSMGDDRDWFRYMHKLRMFERTWIEFMDARRRRKRFDNDFGWNQILVIGDYGAGKTTGVTKTVYEYFRRGHPVFSNASLLLGWRLEDEEMFTAMGFMPKFALLVIDEASGALSSRMGGGVVVSTFNEMNLNSRKRGAKVFYMSAQDWEIAASIRRNCKEVWMPVKEDDIDTSAITASGNGRILPRNNPDNFRMAHHVWGNFPYRKANLIEGKNEDEGFGKPDYTNYSEGDNVRAGFLLTDTFQLAASGAATVADRDAVKDHIRAYQAGKGPVRGKGANPQAVKLLHFLDAHEADPPEYFTASEIGRVLGTSPQAAAGAFREILWYDLGLEIDIAHVRGKGYATEPIYSALMDKLADMAAEGEEAA